MKSYKKLCIVSMTLGFAGSLFSADAAGGYSPVPVSNKDVIAAAEFAVTAQEKAMNGLKDSTPSKLTLVELLSAQQQVVAGMNFRMKLKVKVGGVEKQAEAVVWWQAWRKQDPYRLTRWTWDNGAAMMSAPPKDWMKWAEWIDKLHPVDDGKGHGPSHRIASVYEVWIALQTSRTARQPRDLDQVHGAVSSSGTKRERSQSAAFPNPTDSWLPSDPRANRQMLGSS